MTDSILLSTETWQAVRYEWWQLLDVAENDGSRAVRRWLDRRAWHTRSCSLIRHGHARLRCLVNAGCQPLPGVHGNR
jgi:hypothetical protein